jgi:hypothetical protein
MQEKTIEHAATPEAGVITELSQGNADGRRPVLTD